MSLYLVTRKSDGAAVYRYDAPAPVEWAGMEFATHDHVAQIEASPAPAPYAGSWHITKRAFWNRFPALNEVAMRAVMRGGIGPAALAASLLRLVARVEGSPYVDLKLDETTMGVQWLASAQVPATIMVDTQQMPFRLTAAEVAAILETVPAEKEVWHG